MKKYLYLYLGAALITALFFGAGYCFAARGRSTPPPQDMVVVVDTVETAIYRIMYVPLDTVLPMDTIRITAVIRDTIYRPPALELTPLVPAEITTELRDWRETVPVVRHYGAPRSRWRLTGSVSAAGAPGAGVSYCLVSVAGIDLAPGLSVSTGGDWIAADLHVSRRIWSGVSVGAGAGYTAGYPAGLRLFGAVSICL